MLSGTSIVLYFWFIIVGTTVACDLAHMMLIVTARQSSATRVQRRYTAYVLIRLAPLPVIAPAILVLQIYVLVQTLIPEWWVTMYAILSAMFFLGNILSLANGRFFDIVRMFHDVFLCVDYSCERCRIRITAASTNFRIIR